jgi:hypothetical protein
MHLWETRQKTMPGGPASLSGVAPTLPMLAKMFGADKRMGIPGTLHRLVFMPFPPQASSR